MTLRDALELLFEEAPRGPDPIEDLRGWPTPAGAAAALAPMNSATGILRRIAALPVYEPRRYYRARHGLPDQSWPTSVAGGPESLVFETVVAGEIGLRSKAAVWIDWPAMAVPAPARRIR